MSTLLILLACTGEEPGEEGLERAELGTFTTDADGGMDVLFDVPDAAVSALVYCGPYGYDMLATAETITDPGGAVVYDMEAAPGAMRVDVHADLLPVLIPVSPDLDVSAGEYTLRAYFDSEEAVTATCNGVFRTQAVESTLIDLNFVFVGVDGVAPGLNAATGEDTMVAVVDELTAMWSTGDITINTISYSDFDGDVEKYTVVDGDEELGNLLRTVPTSDRTVTFFFVQDITDDDGATILGLAGGPPGAAAVGSTSKSGVVVNVASFASDPAEIARIIAHEGGHFLGLFHTTEKDGSQTDPLGDTPECSNDADSNGTLSTSECEGTGADNLMWWASSADSTQMSGDQGWVVARSPATH
jgi:hypothetical protein